MKTLNLDPNEYKSNYSRVSSYDRNSLPENSNNQSPKNYAMKQKDLESELFTGKIDLTKQNGVEFDFHFPINCNASKLP